MGRKLLRRPLGALLCAMCCTCTLEPRPTVNRIAIYQNVEFALMQDGAAVTEGTKLMAGRDALVRIFMTPPEQSIPLAVAASFSLDDNVFETSGELSAPSTDADLGSTLNIRVPRSAFAGTHQYEVSLSSGASMYRWPLRTKGELIAASTNGPLSVVLVPVVADGGHAPDVSPAVVQSYRDALIRYLPVADVDVRVRDPYSYELSICDEPRAMSMLATEILALRAQDGAPADAYYYALVAPTATALDYLDCAGGLLGLSLLTVDRDDTYARGAVGAGHFADGTDLQSELTFVHELGHAMGIRHAPCGAALGTDNNYPHAGAAIGRWAWDSATDELKHPLRYKDLMSYCDPSWISDYNFRRFFDRIAYVNLHAEAAVEPMSDNYQSLMIPEEGAPSWLASARVSSPAGTETPLTLESATGTTRAVGYRYQWSHGGGELVLIEAKKLRHAQAVIVDSRRIAVPERHR